jgi:ubiquinone/menaquinone biosynthesis C-methylase UbiE
MFTKSAAYYDAIYSFKDYAVEAEKIHDLIQRHKRSEGSTLLDVACGTGGHIVHLNTRYDVTGIDLDTNMLAVAEERLPDVLFSHADMRDFHMDRQFDVIICVFSSIAYVVTPEGMNQTLENFVRHLKPGGVVLVEPWLRKADIRPGYISVNQAEGDGFKIVRMSKIDVEGDISTIRFHYLLGTETGIDYFSESHVTGLFTDDQYRSAMERVGLETTYLDGGLTNRGLYIGVRPQ